MRPFKVDRFEVVGVLGRGPLGKAYEAIDPSDGSRCALRAFTKPKGVDEERWREATERFTRELEPVVGLAHPSIGGVYEFWERNGVYVIRSEHFVGQNVRQLIDASVRVGLEEALQITRAALQALDYAHARGIVHSDITPYNIVHA